MTLLINVFSAGPLVLEIPVPLEEKEFEGPVLVYEHITKQRQLDAQMNNDSLYPFGLA